MRIRVGESIFYDFTKEGSDTTDSQSCTYFVRDSEDKTILSQELSKQDNTFMLRVGTDDTATLKKENYTLQVAFKDTDTGYMDYILDEELEVY